MMRRALPNIGIRAADRPAGVTGSFPPCLELAAGVSAPAVLFGEGTDSTRTARTNTSAPRRFRKQGRPPLRRLSAAVNCLRQAAGGYVSAAEIIEWVWGDDPEGGPSDTHCVGLIVHHLRRMGFPIVGQLTRGYRYVATGEIA